MVGVFEKASDIRPSLPLHRQTFLLAILSPATFSSPFGQYRGDLDVCQYGAVICHLQSDMYHPAAQCNVGEPLLSPRLSREPSHSRCG